MGEERRQRGCAHLHSVRRVWIVKDEHVLHGLIGRLARVQLRLVRCDVCLEGTEHRTLLLHPSQSLHAQVGEGGASLLNVGSKLVGLLRKVDAELLVVLLSGELLAKLGLAGGHRV